MTRIHDLFAQLSYCPQEPQKQALILTGALYESICNYEKIHFKNEPFRLREKGIFNLIYRQEDIKGLILRMKRDLELYNIYDQQKQEIFEAIMELLGNISEMENWNMSTDEIGFHLVEGAAKKHQIFGVLNT